MAVQWFAHEGKDIKNFNGYHINVPESWSMVVKFGTCPERSNDSYATDRLNTSNPASTFLYFVSKQTQDYILAACFTSDLKLIIRK